MSCSAASAQVHVQIDEIIGTREEAALLRKPRVCVIVAHGRLHHLQLIWTCGDRCGVLPAARKVLFPLVSEPIQESLDD
jgi:hypothetical protein